jgi:hypothetical protein
MKPRIVLRLTVRGWVADWVGDAIVLELFGTTELPTPHGRSADPERVRRSIQELNPNHSVELAEIVAVTL